MSNLTVNVGMHFLSEQLANSQIPTEDRQTNHIYETNTPKTPLSKP